MSRCAPGSCGYSLVESVVVLALVVAASAVATPIGQSAVDGMKPRQAAGFMASQFRLARQRAALTGMARALVFDWSAGRWSFRLCTDGNGNGVRRSELGGEDACEAGILDLAAMFSGARIDVDPSVPDPGGGPGSADPVRFGASDVLTFSPTGSATAGTLYLQGVRGDQYAVRIAGITSRIRVLFFDEHSHTWREV